MRIADAIDQAQPSGESALLDAIKVAIEVTDRAEGVEDAIRGVVVLTDGRDTTSQIRLHDLILMRSKSDECLVSQEDNGLVNQCTENQIDPGESGELAWLLKPSIKSRFSSLESATR